MGLADRSRLGASCVFVDSSHVFERPKLPHEISPEVGAVAWDIHAQDGSVSAGPVAADKRSAKRAEDKSAWVRITSSCEFPRVFRPGESSGAMNMVMYGLDPSTGDIAWERSLNGMVSHAPLLVDGSDNVVLRTHAGHPCRDGCTRGVRSGLLYTFPLVDPSKSTVVCVEGGQDQVAIVDEHVFVSGSDLTRYAISDLSHSVTLESTERESGLNVSAIPLAGRRLARGIPKTQPRFDERSRTEGLVQTGSTLAVFDDSQTQPTWTYESDHDIHSVTPVGIDRLAFVEVSFRGCPGVREGCESDATVEAEIVVYALPRCFEYPGGTPGRRLRSSRKRLGRLRR